MVTEEKQATCQDCKTDFSYTPVMFLGSEMFPRQLCPPCQDESARKWQAKLQKQKEDDRGYEWLSICPPLYRETDVSRLMVAPEIIRKVLAWEPNPIGIGLAGESGTGKTRLLFMLLRKLHFANHRVMFTSGKKFEGYCHRMFVDGDDARQKIREAKQAAVLFIDDIGKEKFTDRVESEFYDLIETRVSNLKPILWTANSSGERLVEMMGEDRGVPIVRRLREFTTVLTV